MTCSGRFGFPAGPRMAVGALLILSGACLGSEPRVVDLHRVPLRSEERAADGHPIASDEVLVSGGEGWIRVEGTIPVGGYCPEVFPSAELLDRTLAVHVEVRSRTRARETTGEPTCTEPQLVSGVAYTFAIDRLPPGRYQVDLHHRAMGPGGRDPNADLSIGHRAVRRLPVEVE